MGERAESGDDPQIWPVCLALHQDEKYRERGWFIGRGSQITLGCVEFDMCLICLGGMSQWRLVIKVWSSAHTA